MMNCAAIVVVSSVLFDTVRTKCKVDLHACQWRTSIVVHYDRTPKTMPHSFRNFVVFDEKLINIVKRYGVAGAAAMLGVAAMDVEQAMAQGMQQPSGLLTPDMINSQQANQRPYNAGLLQ